MDTLKRAVKAGDRTILATSPPYTRFLNDRVDFAIISPAMPHVDLWVQEFMKHEIPCALADYIVKEVICLPAEQGRRDCQGVHRLHTNDNGSNDIACTVCGSHDRGEITLICVNESGSVGCGVGTHVDCCNPPLQEVPEDDWFFPKCSEADSTNSAKREERVLY
ncbi:hypothetical protein CMV_008162 [Castanea mollissima]|uniref:Uncharacterized protein n=1 Tax=Castanea mollissima TaxID=60419 RepID=A0A8J4RCQ4_9ROSI|nr:hypothetical protein CMV_008162 [Castanea mollissima]